MEASALRQPTALRGPSTLLKVKGDERLVALTRRGNHAAYETLVSRYHARLLSFCRHMLGSREDAEDVLQEVFANAFNAMLADERAINVRPWLYRIARNRCLNHLRKVQPIGVDTLDDRMADQGRSTADTAHRREEFRELLGDVQELPETQRTALLLREIEAMPYDRIAEAMETTVPSVKSLLVRARVGLAEASQARAMPCEDVREQLGAAAEGLGRTSSTARRHVRDCESCQGFQAHLKRNNRALAAVLPLGPWVVVKKLVTSLGASGAAGGAAVGGAGAATAVTGGLVTTGAQAIAGKTAAGLAAAAIVTAGAVEVDNVRTSRAATDAPRVERLAATGAGTMPTGPTLRPLEAPREPREPRRPARSTATAAAAATPTDEARAATTTEPATTGAATAPVPTTTAPAPATPAPTPTTTAPAAPAPTTTATTAPTATAGITIPEAQPSPPAREEQTTDEALPEGVVADPSDEPRRSGRRRGGRDGAAASTSTTPTGAGRTTPGEEPARTSAAGEQPTGR